MYSESRRGAAVQRLLSGCQCRVSQQENSCNTCAERTVRRPCCPTCADRNTERSCNTCAERTVRRPCCPTCADRNAERSVDRSCNTCAERTVRRPCCTTCADKNAERSVDRSCNTCADGNARRNRERSCPCREEEKSDFDETYPLAMSYVPWQTLCETTSCDRSLAEGTIFPELVKPFMRGGRCNG